MVVYETFHPAHVGVRGRTIGDLARARGCEPWDALCDLVVADGLRTSFGPPPRGATRRDWAAKAAVIRDRRTVIGGSDAGAHVDMIADYAYPTRLFAEAVRAHRALSIEEAVHQLTERPARLYGLRDRGRLVEGGHADFVVLDAATVDVGELEQRHDLPGGAARLHACPRGVDYVGVNGVLAIDRCRPTGARCGALLRAGADTTTPSLE